MKVRWTNNEIDGWEHAGKDGRKDGEKERWTERRKVGMDGQADKCI